MIVFYSIMSCFISKCYMADWWINCVCGCVLWFRTHHEFNSVQWNLIPGMQDALYLIQKLKLYWLTGLTSLFG